MKKRKLVLLLFFAILLITCCACRNSESSVAETGGSMNVKTLKTEAYSLVLPESITAKEKENGSMILFFDGKEVGGVTSIHYENAEDFVNTEDSDGNALQNEERHSELNAKVNQLLTLIAPEGKVDHMFNASRNGSGKTLILLSVVPWPEKNEPEMEHHLLAKGDAFYDLSFQTGVIPEMEANLLLDSFTLNL